MVGKRSAIKEIPLGGKVAYGMLAASLPLAFFLGRADTESGRKEAPPLVTPADIPGAPTSEGAPGSHLPTPAASHADEPQNGPESPVADEDTQPADEDTKAPHKPAQSLTEAKATRTPGKPAKAARKKTKHAKHKAKQTAKPTATKKPGKPKPKQTAKPEPESSKGPVTSFIEDTTGISVPDALNPLHMFLARVSDEPLAVSYDEHADTVTMTAVLSEETAVQVEVTGAEECSRKDPATVTAQTVDPQTEEPTGEPVTADVTNPDNLSGVGIAAAVEAVLTPDTEEPRSTDTGAVSEPGRIEDES
jgi:hypothetical protein